MSTLTTKSVFLQYYRSSSALRAGDFDPAHAWPAPVKKTSTLVLKRPAPLLTDALAQVVQSSAVSSAPFPTPVRDNAFEVPRPATVPGVSSAWAPLVRKSPAAVLGVDPEVRAEVEFPRPAFPEKLSMRHGQFCRSC